MMCVYVQCVCHSESQGTTSAVSVTDSPPKMTTQTQSVANKSLSSNVGGSGGVGVGGAHL